MDGYIQMRFAGKIFKTKIVKMNKNENTIVWNQEVSFAVELPLFNDDLKVQVWDKNDAASDTCMGSLPFKMKNICKNIYEKAGWYNIYGSPVNNPDRK